jgi:hypothetical protein
MRASCPHATGCRALLTVTWKHTRSSTTGMCRTASASPCSPGAWSAPVRAYPCPRTPAASMPLARPRSALTVSSRLSAAGRPSSHRAAGGQRGGGIRAAAWKRRPATTRSIFPRRQRAPPANGSSHPAVNQAAYRSFGPAALIAASRLDSRGLRPRRPRRSATRPKAPTHATARQPPTPEDEKKRKEENISSRHSSSRLPTPLNNASQRPTQTHRAGTSARPHRPRSSQAIADAGGRRPPHPPLRSRTAVR